MLNFFGYFLGDFHVFVLVSYHVDLELFVYLGFQGIMFFFIICTPAKYTYFIFSLTFSLFILLNVHL